MKILILYYSKTGHTLEAANAVAGGIKEAGSEVDIVGVADFETAMLADFDGLILGSPCRAGSVTPWGVAQAVIRALGDVPADSLKGKRGGGISVHAKMGGKTTVKSLGKLLAKKGCEDYRPGPAVKGGVPFSLWKGPSVKADDLELLKTYGAEFVAQD